MFGKAGAGFIRMCILRNPDDLKVALDRMATVLR
jgi:bifunctional pyridoxal-dependent enzyme with beta-cystathionase and maltose regulon repressor activities